MLFRAASPGKESPPNALSIPVVTWRTVLDQKLADLYSDPSSISQGQTLLNSSLVSRSLRGSVDPLPKAWLLPYLLVGEQNRAIVEKTMKLKSSWKHELEL